MGGAVVTFKLEINCDNAAFQSEAGDDWATGHEIMRILDRLAREICDSCPSAGDEFALVDINGNRVGTATLEE